MPSKISHNAANEDVAAINAVLGKTSKTTKNCNPLLALPQEILFLIFQFLITEKSDVSRLERSSKAMLTLVNNSNLAYNVWLLMCKRTNLSITYTSATQTPILQIRKDVKKMHVNSNYFELLIYPV